MERTLKDTFTLGVDDATGRAVIIRNSREVIGGLDRGQSVSFAQDVIEWMPRALRPVETDKGLS